MQYDEKKLDELGDMWSGWAKTWPKACTPLIEDCLEQLKACRKPAPPPDPDAVWTLACKLFRFKFPTMAELRHYSSETQREYRGIARYVLKHYVERKLAVPAEAKLNLNIGPGKIVKGKLRRGETKFMPVGGAFSRGHYCARCGYFWSKFILPDFCPNCGAKAVGRMG